MPLKIVILLVAALFALAACKKSLPAAPAASPAAVDAAAPVTRPALAASPAPAPSFDISSVPVSSAPLGDFPYITLPAGYTSAHFAHSTVDFARFPFWVNGQAVWVEGKFYRANFAPVSDKQMSEYEVEKNFEAVISRLGGVKLSEGKIPGDVIKGWGNEITMGFIDGLGDIYNQPATTYVIHRADGNIWVHLVTTLAMGSYIIGREKAFQATAKALPASELKAQIDKDGKVALHVNFATDKTDILPDSQPQIVQVVQLLKDDATLNLAVNGHTDNSGDAAHNKTLSQGRAMAVVATLVAQGIDPARLTAAGFGDTRPVADNATEEGKAQNRRVELVKR